MLGYLEAAPTMQEPIIWTPSAIKQLAINLHQDILVFNNDMAKPLKGKTIPQSQLEAWRLYRDGWAKWYGATSASTWLWSATVSVIEDYANKLAAWREWYNQNIGIPSGAGSTSIAAFKPLDTSGKQELQLPEFDWTPVWWGAGALIVFGGGYLWWLRKH